MTESEPVGGGVQLLDQRMQQLVKDAADGNHAAFENLYRLSIRTLLPSVQRISGIHAEDVLADTYVQAWKTLETFDATRCTVTGWLLTIARSRARDRMRLERTRHAGMDGAMAFDPDHERYEGAGPEELANASQQRHQLCAAVATLNPAQRWVISLAYYRDLSHTEISALTGMPLGTVKTLILRSQKDLRGMMQVEARSSLSNPHAAIAPS
jgi:RNA polymerase sigma-70 factor (ECF subfamily)